MQSSRNASDAEQRGKSAKIGSMCGRYGRTADKQHIAEWMQPTIRTSLKKGFRRSYNISPTDIQPVVRLSRDMGERELPLMRWGVAPWRRL